MNQKSETQILWRNKSETEWRRGRVLGPAVDAEKYVSVRNRAWEGERIFRFETYVLPVTLSDSIELNQFLTGVK